MDILECLMRLGFTRHESLLYLTLCREGELTGYEASKISGIPRSNAYLALAGLVEKGGVFEIDGDAKKYSAVPAKELAANFSRSFGAAIEFIKDNTPEKSDSKDPYITISGNVNIINKMKNIIEGSKDRVYISLSHAEIRYVENEIRAAVQKGMKVVIITSQGLEVEGALMYYTDKKSGQIRLIADSTDVLTGELKEDAVSTCLYSRNRNLIDLIKDSLTNEIKLINLNRKE